MAQDIHTKMLKNAVHIGHTTSQWNPEMRKYIYGEMDGIHIIDLKYSADMLNEAIKFLSKTLSEGKTVLFVSTKLQTKELLKDLAVSVNMPYVNSKWVSGLLTNFDTIKSRIKYLIDLKEQFASKEIEKFTKKEIAKFKKEMDKLELSLGGVKDMKSLPDVVFLVDPGRDEIVVDEAKNLGIKVVAFADTNVNPERIDYPIPANDDAIKPLKFLFSEIKKAISK